MSDVSKEAREALDKAVTDADTQRLDECIRRLSAAQRVARVRRDGKFERL